MWDKKREGELLAAVLAVVNESDVHALTKKKKAQAIGKLIEICLQMNNISLKEFADALDMELVLGQGILEGFLPVDEMADDLLDDISGLIHLHPKHLYGLAGRIQPQKVANSEPPKKEVFNMLDEFRRNAMNDWKPEKV